MSDELTLEVFSQIAQIVLSVAALIASVAVPWAIHERDKRRVYVEYVLSTRNLWIAIDTAAVNDARLMRIADSVNNPESDSLTDDERAQMWFGYMFFNIVYSNYTAIHNGLLPAEELVSVKRDLRKLLKCSASRRVAEAYGPSAFYDVCLDIMHEIDKEGPVTKK